MNNILNIEERLFCKGYVEWELIDEITGYKYSGGNHNIITNTGRERIARLITGLSTLVPDFVGIGTGTTTPVASNTALITPVDYDGANEAKQASLKEVKSLFHARIVTQFATSEANQNIRELGLFDAANTGNLWARVLATINKTSSQRLTVYWNLIFERNTGVAIKTGASIGATGTINGQTASQSVSFASPVTFLKIHNNTGGDIYISLTDDFASYTTQPDEYDYLLLDNESLQLFNEEFSISTLYIYKDSVGNITMPDKTLSIRGW